MPKTISDERKANYQRLFAVIPSKYPKCPPWCVVARTMFLFALEENHVNHTIIKGTTTHT